MQQLPMVGSVTFQLRQAHGVDQSLLKQFANVFGSIQLPQAHVEHVTYEDHNQLNIWCEQPTDRAQELGSRITTAKLTGEHEYDIMMPTGALTGKLDQVTLLHMMDGRSMCRFEFQLFIPRSSTPWLHRAWTTVKQFFSL